jgi:predicted nicotinamide N-methyase
MTVLYFQFAFWIHLQSVPLGSPVHTRAPFALRLTRSESELLQAPCWKTLQFRASAALNSRAGAASAGAFAKAMRYKPPSDVDDAATVFFELANAKTVKYKCKSGARLVIDQDSNIKDCTGGIVWETALLLATYLEGRGIENLGWRRADAGSPGTGGESALGKRSGGGAKDNAEVRHKKRKKGDEKGMADEQTSAPDDVREPARSGAPRVLEVGSGCGLLGLVLGHLGAQVVLSEAAEAMQILTSNVDKKRNRQNLPPHASVRALKLDWTSETDISALQTLDVPAPFDVIVGTDVIFNITLVEPLLRLLHRASHANTTVWLCMQERCPDAHKTLLELAPKYFQVHDRSADLAEAPGCKCAAELDCFLLCLTCRKETVSTR